MPTLGAFIRRRRIELGLTQESLAEMVGGGVRQAEISRLEHDRVTLPRRQRLEQIAAALDVPLGELLVRSGWTGADDIDTASGTQTVEIEQLRAINEELQSRAERLESTVSVLATSNVTLRSQIVEVQEETRQTVVQQFMQPVLDAVIDPVVIIGESGEIVSENAAFTDLRTEHGGLARITTADGNPIAGAMGSFRPGDTDDETCQSVIVVNDDDGRSWYEVHVKPVSLDDGTRVSVVTVKDCDAPDS
ncbi:MAG TPA: helix-turn-helix domain-containing protein [Thermomicrobiales bacterium]|nr:helix-turn-helix domain-containing protein [Thermomicrobiales bacterium]